MVSIAMVLIHKWW